MDNRGTVLICLMVGIALAALAFLAAATTHVALSHTLRVTRKERTLVGCLVGGACAYTVGFIAGYEPATILGVPRRLPVPLDLLTGLCALGFLSLGYLEFWSLVERSFSLRILIDLANAEPLALTAAQLACSYGGGIGLDGMMEKRIQGLLGSGMMTPDAGSYSLTSRGRLIATVFAGLRASLGFRTA